MKDIPIFFYSHAAKGGTSLYISNLVNNLYNYYKNIWLYTDESYQDNFGPIGYKIIYLSRNHMKLDKGLKSKIDLILTSIKGIYNFYHEIIHHNENGVRGIIHVQFPFIFTDFFYFRKLRKENFLILTVHDVIPHKFILSKPIHMFFWRETLKTFDHFIVHSKKNKTQLSSIYNIPEIKISVIEHGIEVAREIDFNEIRIFREIYNIPNNRKIILFFGSIRENKGLDTLLNSLSKVEKGSFYLIIAGKCKNDHDRKLYNDIIQSYGLSEDILFIDRFINDEEIPILFNIADLCVLPYKSFYSQSGVLTTAITYSLPVIVSDTGSMGDFVRENNIGVVFSPKNELELSKKIESFIKEDLSQYKKACKNCIDKLNWGLIANKTLGLYEALIPFKNDL